MKRLFTLFLASACLTIFSVSGYAQTLPHAVVLYPSHSHFVKMPSLPSAKQNSLFLEPTKNTPMLSPLVLPPDSALFYTDTTDNTKLGAQLEPSFINLVDNSGNKTPDTLVGYSEHFTSPYLATQTFLDSVQYVFAITNIGTFDNNFIRIYSTKTKTVNGAIVPGTGIDTVDIDPTGFTSIVSDPTAPMFYIQTVRMNSKLVGSKEFFVNVTSAFDPTQSLITTDMAQNQMLLECDELDFTTYNSKVNRGVARAYNDGNVDNVDIPWAGITDNNHTAPGFYSNFWIIAYVSNTPSNAVNDTKLEGNALAQNYPNPFNPSTVIKYSLANESAVSLKVYNTLGVEVATIVNDNEASGEHQVTFMGDNLPSGTYFYTLKAGTFSQTKRMVLSK